MTGNTGDESLKDQLLNRQIILTELFLRHVQILLNRIKKQKIWKYIITLSCIITPKWKEYFLEFLMIFLPLRWDFLQRTFASILQSGQRKTVY